MPKQFAVSIALQAVDQVTGPVKKMTGNVRQAATAMSRSFLGIRMGADKANEGEAVHGKEGGGIFGEFVKAEFFVDAIKEAASQVIDFGKESVAAYNESSVSMARLQNMMMNVKGTTLEQVKAMDELSESSEQKTTIDADAMRSGMSQLATFRLTYKQLKLLAPAYQDLITGTWGLKLNSDEAIDSANQLGKVFMGQTGALKRVGISFDKAEESVMRNGTAMQKTAMLAKVLEENYGGWAKKLASTDAGKAVMVHNQLELAMKHVGKSLIPLQTMWNETLLSILPGIDRIAKSLPDVMSQVTRSFKALKPQLTVFLEPVRQAFDNKQTKRSAQKIGESAIKAVTPWGILAATIARDFAKWIGENMPIMRRWLTDLGDGFNKLGVACLWVWNHALSPLCDGIVTGLDVLMVPIEWLINIPNRVSEVWDGLAAASKPNIDAIKKDIEDLTKWMKPVIDWYDRINRSSPAVERALNAEFGSKDFYDTHRLSHDANGHTVWSIRQGANRYETLQRDDSGRAYYVDSVIAKYLSAHARHISNVDVQPDDDGNLPEGRIKIDLNVTSNAPGTQVTAKAAANKKNVAVNAKHNTLRLNMGPNNVMAR